MNIYTQTLLVGCYHIARSIVLHVRLPGGFLAVTVNTGVSRAVGGSVAAAHQRAESDGFSQPVATAGHVAPFHD